MGGGVQGRDALESGNLAVLSHYGESVMEVVCRDACDGSDVVRMLAFAVLDCIVVFDWQYKWLNYMMAKGYLRHCINSLVHEDSALQAMLAPNPEPLKSLYIYESKMVSWEYGFAVVFQSVVFVIHCMSCTACLFACLSRWSAGGLLL